MKQIKLKISGMSCAACASSIERSLKRKDFIGAVEVDLIAECANVAFDEQKADAQTIIALIQRLGYGAEIFSDKRQNKRQNSDFLIAIIFAIPLFCVSMGAMAFESVNQPLICGIEMALLIPILYAGRKIYAHGFNSLVRLVPNMDSLVFLGSLSAIVFSLYKLATLGLQSPHLLHNLYFESAGVIIAVIMLGKHLESRATQSAKTGIESLMNMTPKTALKAQGAAETLEIRIEHLARGDIIVIPKGAMFSVDCVLLDESCVVDESVITGESAPKRKARGDLIYSGAINRGEQARARVENLAQDSMISKIISLMRDVKKAPIARVADSISAYFVPCVIALATIAAIAWGVGSGDFHKAFIVFASTLLISCPCALGLATPLSILVATSRAAKQAIYFKNAESLERASKITTLVFDKTGTLTDGDLRVLEFVELRDSAESRAESRADSAESRQDSADSSVESRQKSEIFALIHALESKSEHIIAKAILRYTRDFARDLSVESVQTHEGKGISAIVDGKLVRIGKADFVGLANLPQSAAIPHTTCFVSVEGEILGFFIIADSLREGAKTLIANLKNLSIKSIILSGDNEKSVESVARLCGVGEFHHSQLPQDKLDFIQNLQARGEIVGFVGDGINDALALTQANIGIAISASSDIAIKQSDIILLNNNLQNIHAALLLSRQTLRNIKENLGFAFVYNICAIPIAVGIPQVLGVNLALNPMIAGIAMGLSSISVVLNALRLR